MDIPSDATAVSLLRRTQQANRSFSLPQSTEPRAIVPLVPIHFAAFSCHSLRSHGFCLMEYSGRDSARSLVRDTASLAEMLPPGRSLHEHIRKLSVSVSSRSLGIQSKPKEKQALLVQVGIFTVIQ